MALCPPTGLVAVAFESGACHLLATPADTDYADSTPSALSCLSVGHQRGTRCLAFATTTATDAVALVSGGDDGCVHIETCHVNSARVAGRGCQDCHGQAQVATSAPRDCPIEAERESGATTKRRRLLIDEVVADSTHWAVPLGRSVCVGLLSSGQAAAPASCDGWARSLVASPDGAWLAAWVVVAGLDATASSKLWLWRCADGSPSPTRPRPSDVRHVSATCPPRADFECGGFGAPISALAWRPDSACLASCSGSEVLLWRFGAATAAARSSALPSGPAGRAPRRLDARGSRRLVSAAFRADGAWLACGASDGSLHLFACEDGASAARVIRPMVRWLGGSTLLASGPGAVAVVACVVPPELESNAESTVASMRVEHYPPAPEGVAAVLCTAIGGGWRMAEG
ncbi:hypothetical protein EMIHUDRAFT_449218 [Emiliania huxleyi CCMP1516]|uniref:Anaphase-promoting complex subunit 4 WD40 domain-containing protein n=2 Tax=Emiliania huxleyi TaxID=2903 RepID=A0A0D3KI50_EMIH1|nr:hypothetical protein EMIHUDRAFT_449218 [Emiliania huxleyi CCMP1516]EOD35435.1 hypothetical protein EMIHUDRAFT_449218 [Emiliania huxleyi CCMP1516]|eukprot:XP_005787864.1 hypothetical protein EMIHUDRAFT_449218 [Emiliania huxleyi CCMP1516]